MTASHQFEPFEEPALNHLYSNDSIEGFIATHFDCESCEEVEAILERLMSN
jgi:hypothetical protein